MSKEITFETLNELLNEYNELCKDQENTRAIEKRRAVSKIRRKFVGNQTLSNEQLIHLGEILSKAEHLIAEECEKAGFENIAMNSLQMAEDIEEVVLEIVTVEEEENDE
jgi:hypothetical protein